MFLMIISLMESKINVVSNALKSLNIKISGNKIS